MWKMPDSSLPGETANRSEAPWPCVEVEHQDGPSASSSTERMFDFRTIDHTPGLLLYGSSSQLHDRSSTILSAVDNAEPG